MEKLVPWDDEFAKDLRYRLSTWIRRPDRISSLFVL